MTLDHLPGQNILAGEMPEIQWVQGDDLCDCTFQRIGEWTNPYIARTLRVRMCCIWAELYKDYPQFVQEIPAFYNYNEDRMETEPWQWNGESDMPPDIWHRQLAVLRREPLSVVREKFEGIEPPKGIPRKKEEQGEPMGQNLYEIIGKQTEEILELKRQLEFTMNFLKQLKSGEMTLDNIVVANSPEKEAVAANGHANPES